MGLVPFTARLLACCAARQGGVKHRGRFIGFIINQFVLRPVELDGSGREMNLHPEPECRRTASSDRSKVALPLDVDRVAGRLGIPMIVTADSGDRDRAVPGPWI